MPRTRIRTAIAALAASSMLAAALPAVASAQPNGSIDGTSCASYGVGAKRTVTDTVTLADGKTTITETHKYTCGSDGKWHEDTGRFAGSGKTTAHPTGTHR